MVLLEVCVDSFEKGLEACSNGFAQRLELCSDLSLEGFTPSLELIQQFLNYNNREVETGVDQQTIPLHVMIRPRCCTSSEKNMIDSFCYDESMEERELMKQQIRAIKQLINSEEEKRKLFCGNHKKPKFLIEGFVIGCIRREQDFSISIDSDLLSELIEIINQDHSPFNITFHKAFDLLSKPIESLAILSSLGVNRILTSLCFSSPDLKGKIMTAIECSANSLEKICSESNHLKIVNFLNQLKTLEKMTLLIGGGVRDCNQGSIIDFMNQQNCVLFELHSSTPFQVY